MAKPLNERIASARSTDRVTITDLHSLIADLSGELARQTAVKASSARESEDVALSEDARDAAALVAGRAGRLQAGYLVAIEEFKAKLAAKLDSEKQRERVAEREAVEKERDELVARWRNTWPRLAAEMIDLFQATKANEARLSKMEPNAEALARDLHKNFMAKDGRGYMAPITEMKIDSLAGHPRLWPLPGGVHASFNAYQRPVFRPDAELPWHGKAAALEEPASDVTA